MTARRDGKSVRNLRAMRKDLVDILACPVCKNALVLTIEEEDERGEVRKGSLFCGRCNEPYPIDDGIPNLLPPELRGS
jgi:uncharacterized protein YbaR (Trm112 family)